MPDFQYSQPTTPAKKNSWLFPCLITLGVLVVLGVLGVTGIVVGSLYFAPSLKGFQEGFDETIADTKLKAISDETNKTLPGTPDNGVLLVSTTTEPHRRFIYHYKMLDMTSADAPATFAHDVRERLITSFKGNADIKTFMDLKATVVFEYHDKNDVLIAAVPIDEDDLK